MNQEDRYHMIFSQRQGQAFIEVGFGEDKGLQHLYFLCHSCKDGIKSMQGEENIVIKVVEHIASEQHKILLGDY